MSTKTCSLTFALALLLSLLCAVSGMARDKGKAQSVQEGLKQRFGEQVDI